MPTIQTAPLHIDLLSHEQTPPWDLLLLADPSRMHVEHYLSQGFCYVARQDEEIVGAYVLLETAKDRVEIKNLVVAEAYQHKGIGRHLLLDAIIRAENAGYLFIEIRTGNSSLYQIKLYRSCGFRMTHIIKDYFKDYPQEIYEDGVLCLDLICFEKKLNSKEHKKINQASAQNSITKKMQLSQKMNSPFVCAQEIQRMAALEGFDWDHPRDVLANVQDEVEEILEELAKPKLDSMRLLDEYSDLLFVVLGLARHLKITPQEALEYANRKFIQRFSKVEEQVFKSGKSMKELGFDQLMEYWEFAKRNS